MYLTGRLRLLDRVRAQIKHTKVRGFLTENMDFYPKFRIFSDRYAQQNVYTDLRENQISG